jgi:hypothetical protein
MLTIVFALIFVAASACYVNTAEAQRAVEAGLVSFWPLDEATIDDDTVQDIVGENHGSIAGSPKIVPGKINEALEFNGSSDYVDCGGDESLNLTDALTIEVWIMPNVAGEGGSNVGPVCRAIAGGSWNWQLRYNAPGGFMGFQFNAGGSKWISVQQNLEPGEWYHIMGTYDGSDAVCYLNGEETQRMAMPAINGSGDNFFIGQDGWANVFNGVVDEVRMYNRALSAAEVRQNYNSRSQLAVEPAGKLAITWAVIKTEN